MKKLYTYLSALAAMILVTISCQQAPILTINGNRSFSFTKDGGTQTISFTTNRDWKVSSSESWCRISQSSGSASDGSIQVTITCDPNSTYDTRKCTITVSNSELMESLTVSQETNLGLMVSPTSFDLTKDAQDIVIEVQKNVQYVISIDGSCADWVKVASTKGLSTDKITLSIAANESYDAREGKVTFKETSGSLQQEVIIRQQNTEEPMAIPIEDAVFKAYLVAHFDTNGDREISGREALAIKTIDVETDMIKSVQGIEYMTNLETLACYGSGWNSGEDGSKGKLEKIDVSKNVNLAWLECSSNHISELDITNNPYLTTLICYGNNLSSLDVSQNRFLKKIDCKGNHLSTLNVAYQLYLTNLDCSYNELSTIDVSQNTELKKLFCSSNKIDKIDISSNTSLTTLNCDRNNLSALDVTNNLKLEGLSCGNNHLPSIDVSLLTNLKSLGCYSNPINGLDVSHNTALTHLTIADCGLSSIDLSNNINLTTLYCGDNLFTTIDLSKNVELETLDVFIGELTELDISQNTKLRSLNCALNKLTSLDVSKNTLLKFLRCEPMTDSNGENLLNTLYIYPGQEIPYVTVNRNYNYIPGGTMIIEVHDGDEPVIEGNITFEDAVFKAYLTQYYDRDKDGEISYNEALSITNIILYDPNVTSLQGIENMPNLKALYCDNTSLTYLDVSKNTKLEELSCTWLKELTTLDLSKNTALTYLSCSSNKLTSLDLKTNNALKELWCDANSLKTLDISNLSSLLTLGCSDCSLETIDVSNNPQLSKLSCGQNKISILDLSANLSLSELYCRDNMLETLILPENEKLTLIDCTNNQLTELNVSHNPAVTTIKCAKNKISSFDFSNNSILDDLDCGGNQLTSLDVSNKTALRNLSCTNNKLTSLNVSNDAALLSLYCEENLLETLNVSSCPILFFLRCNPMKDTSGKNLFKTLYVSPTQEIYGVTYSRERETYLPKETEIIVIGNN